MYVRPLVSMCTEMEWNLSCVDKYIKGQTSWKQKQKKH